MHRILSITVLFVVCVVLGFAEEPPENIIIQNQDVVTNDTTSNKDTLVIPIISPSGVDSVITFYSADTTKVNLKTKKVLLIGNAQIDFQQQQLNAAVIEIDFNTSELTASLVRDSAGKPIGVPKMKDGGEEYYGETLTYNIKNNTGTIKMGETQMGEGFYFGEYISRVAKNE